MSVSKCAIARFLWNVSTYFLLGIAGHSFYKIPSRQYTNISCQNSRISRETYPIYWTWIISTPCKSQLRIWHVCWHSSATTCQIFMLTCQVFKLSCHICMSTCHMYECQLITYSYAYEVNIKRVPFFVKIFFWHIIIWLVDITSDRSTYVNLSEIYVDCSVNYFAFYETMLTWRW